MFHRCHVSVKDDVTYVVNDAVSGTYTISFAVATGTLSGTASVRVSEKILSRNMSILTISCERCHKEIDFAEWRKE